MPQQISPAGSGPLLVGSSPEPSGWEWSRGLRAEPDDHRRGCEQGRVRVESMVVQELVGRDKLFQTHAVIGWEDGEEDGLSRSCARASGEFRDMPEQLPMLTSTNARRSRSHLS